MAFVPTSPAVKQEDLRNIPFKRRLLVSFPLIKRHELIAQNAAGSGAAAAPAFKTGSQGAKLFKKGKKKKNSRTVDIFCWNPPPKNTQSDWKRTKTEARLISFCYVTQNV